jgi:hypothetical protein
MATQNTQTTKSRILDILPSFASGGVLSTEGIVTKLNGRRRKNLVSNATVRGRLSELRRAGLIDTETTDDGKRGFYSVQ